jgi:RimJ/RimL family protein N-acetyltransferase
MPNQEITTETVETARLLLRPFTEADRDALAGLYADPEVTRFLPQSSRTPEERAARTIAFFNEHWEAHGFGVWAVVERASGAVIGQCGLNHLPEPVEIEVLYALAKSAWGKGIATEAAAASVQYGFMQAGLDRIIALAVPENTASRRVMEKIGLHYECDTHLFGLDLAQYAVERKGD